MVRQIPQDALSLLSKIPAIPAIPVTRVGDLGTLYERLQAILSRSPRSRLLSFLKYVACAVLLANAGSLPFVWHIRVFWPIFAARLEYYALRSRLLFTPKAERAKILTAWAEGLSPVGANPFEIVTVYRRWASIDDTDMFGMHLSNSSYAKVLDSARLRALIKAFPAWGRSGGQMALGASHYHFIREIPFFAKYEIRLTFGSWDHKWIYLIARYVTRPVGRNAKRSPSTSASATPNQGISESATPNGVEQNGTVDVEKAVNAIVGGRTAILEPDGSILHCVAVSQICFKHGRITIPPAVVLGAEGFTKPPAPDSGISTYSRSNPPPSWAKSQAIRVAPLGSMSKFQAFLKGGWRDVPEGERWWEEALGGSIEEKRQANLEILESLKLGLERTRSIY
ncbi:hypothetical protein HYDPIDRAFT_187973 [Hydnomerulius pinastri MD-312]|uniref:Uncharacterized protein n=1 Tax=Hydnomerulius pinastri MD-312 TaxID=994086 RepID=A0A0C9W953_9AGAM|nr:hypothetical protein HYDPIDRAFT_187973 [Hydnomerulius pinastri MD-312]